jgi:hypothetical protein
MVAEKTYTDYRATDIRRRLKYIVELTSIAIIYVALAKLSLALASIHPSATPIWPQQASLSDSYYCWDMELLPLFSLAPSLPTSQLRDRSARHSQLLPAIH